MLYYFLLFNFIKMAIEKLKDDTDWMAEEEKKLSKLKGEIIKNKEYIPPEEVKKQISYLNQFLDVSIDDAKKQWLSLKEEEIIRKAYNRLVKDINKHPNAYIMPIERLKEFWTPYSFRDGDKFGFIDDFDLRKYLGAEFNLTLGETAIFETYHILED